LAAVDQTFLRSTTNRVFAGKNGFAFLIQHFQCLNNDAVTRFLVTDRVGASRRLVLPVPVLSPTYGNDIGDQAAKLKELKP